MNKRKNLFKEKQTMKYKIQWENIPEKNWKIKENNEVVFLKIIFFAFKMC